MGPALFKWRSPPRRRRRPQPQQLDQDGVEGKDFEDNDDVDLGIEYALRLLPLGGFVSFPPFYNVSDITINSSPDDGPIKVFDDPDLLQNRSPLQRVFVLSSGVVANLLLAWTCLGLSISQHGLPRQTFEVGNRHIFSMVVVRGGLMMMVTVLLTEENFCLRAC